MKTLIYLLGILVALAGILSSCNDEDENEYPIVADITIKVNSNPEFGSILTDGDGNTLYFFAKDIDGNSECNGPCEDAWPAFFTEEINVGNDLNKADFATINRANGEKQITFKGWPLYYFAQDEVSGDVNGDGIGNVWYVGKPDYSLMIGKKAIEDQEQLFMVDQEGNSLYFFLQDEENNSNCNGNCLVNWPAFFQDPMALPSFFNSADFGIIDRENNEKQISYKGKPVYFFANDNQRGDINGHEVGDVWFLLAEDELAEDL